MKLISESIRPNERIPDRCCFGNPAAEGHMTLGENRSPHLRWSGVPADATSLVLVCIDPDVPCVADDVNQEGKTIPAGLNRVDFFHWVMVDLPARDGELQEGECSSEVTPKGKSSPQGPPGSRQGVNDYTGFMAGDPDMGGTYRGYDGPCPPWNDERLHHYHFRQYATDLASCPAGADFSGKEVLDAIRGHVLAEAEIVGTYSLNPAVR